RIHIGIAQRLGNHFGLPTKSRRGITDAHTAIIIDRRTQQSRVNLIAIPYSVGHAFQRYNANPVPHDTAASVGIKGTALAIGRENAPIFIEIASDLREKE